MAKATTSTKPTVLVLGAGFAGLGAARELRHADVDVVLVDRHDYHTFQPLLYQVATDVLDAQTVGHPVRELLHRQGNLRFHRAEATAVDLAARRVTFDAMAPLGYDHLVIGVGARVDYFGVPGAAEHAFPLYTLEDAIRLRDHVLRCFEAADRDPSLMADGILDIVVVGGGPTGVETAGALGELLRSVFTRDYPDLPVASATITLVERGDRLLAMFPPHLGDYARHQLEERGVTMRLGDEVTSVTPTRATISSGGGGGGAAVDLPAHTLVWAAGLQPSALVGSLGVALEHGRVPVQPDLSLDGHPEVFVAGDVALTPGGHGGGPLPQLGSVALQAGEHIGRTIRTRLDGGTAKPFHYLDKGTMATIGRGAAVVELPGGHHLTGRLAWLAWGAVHLALLTGGDDRAAALTNWAWTFFTADRPSRIILDRVDLPTHGAGDDPAGPP